DRRVGGDAGPDAAGDACLGCRSFALATTGVQALPGSEPLFKIGVANVTDDADAVAVHQDFYGLPWEAFEAATPPPIEWAAVMDLIQQRTAGHDVFLSLQLVGGAGRQYLASKTVIVGGQITTQDNWSARCYDFATMADGT